MADISSFQVIVVEVCHLRLPCLDIERVNCVNYTISLASAQYNGSRIRDNFRTLSREIYRNKFMKQLLISRIFFILCLRVEIK